MVLCIAGVVLFFTRDTSLVISLLLVSCPMEIIISGPLAMVAALTAAARLGVLIKNVTDIEIAQKLTAIVFDKTGTLTTGNLAVTRLYPVTGTDPADLLQMAASLEQHSRHPIARAVVAMSERARIDLSVVEDFEEVAGRGVRGRLNGREVMAGRESWIRECGVYIPANLLDDAGSMSVLLLAEKGRCIGWVGLSDQTREHAATILDELRELGLQQRMMVTGDRRGPAEQIAESLDLTGMVAEALPGDKLDIVKELKQRGHTVAVIGDGVNDGPALAAADLSIAMGAAGSDVAINAASIALMNSQLNRLPFLVRLSRATTRVIRQNIIFVMLYIVCMIVLLSLGYITPLIAAIAHGLSSIVVVFNSARLIRQGEDLPVLEDMERVRSAQATKRAHRAQPMPVAVTNPVMGRIAG
jgi:Cd2+/Zn2+-exporting ATPase